MAARELPSTINNPVHNKEVVKHLVEVFGSNFDFDLIYMVASNCNFDVEATTNLLLEMSSNTDTTSGLIEKKELGPKEHVGALCNDNLKSDTTVDYDDDVIIESEQIFDCIPQKMNMYQTPVTSFAPPKQLSQPTSIVERKSKKELEFDRIVLHVRQGTKILIFMRGVPGSGKSYLAKEIVDKGVGLTNYHTFILSTDDYFINQRTGQYEYDVRKIQAAHEWNQQRAYKSLSQGVSPIIIDNTNTEMWEMKSYSLMAVNFGYYIEIVEPLTYWAFNEKELARRNRHGVPRSKIKDMLERYQKNVTPMKLFSAFNLTYNSNVKPPLYRQYPLIPHTKINNGFNTHLTNFCQPNENVYNVQVNKINPKHVNLMNFENDAPTNVSNDKESNINNLHLQKSISVDSILRHSSNAPMNCRNNTALPIPTHNVDFSSPERFSLNINASSSFEDTTYTQNKKFKKISGSPAHENVYTNITKEATEIHKARNKYPSLNLSSWGLPENAMSFWESWDVVSPLNGPREPQIIKSTENNLNQEFILETAESTTNTSSSDFLLLNSDISKSDFKVLLAQNRNINHGIGNSPPPSPPKKTLLDKSSMTEDNILNVDVIMKNNVNCTNDIDELVSLFPNVPRDYLNDVYEKCSGNLNWTVDLLLDDNKEFLDSSINTNNSTELNNIKSTTADGNKLPSEPNTEELTISNSAKNKTSFPDLTELKEHLEKNVEINKDYYSEHVLKIKQQKHANINEQQWDKPSTSTNFSLTEEATVVHDVEEDTEDYGHDTDSTHNDDEEEETIELNLGASTVSVLEQLFGFPEELPRGLLPIVKVPIWLAKQLHALYVQSLCQQMETQNNVLDMIIKQDEELAKKLQLQETTQLDNVDRKTPDLRIIMDEEVAINLYKKDSEKWKTLTPDTLAAKLTHQKLSSSFPTIDKNVLLEILHAHDNSYEQTLEVLLASAEEDKIYDPDGTLREPPITKNTIEEMKTAEEEIRTSIAAPDAPKTANQYREEANEHLHKHNVSIQKAQQAYQSKQYAVAQFYSEIAKTHTQLFDQANNLAASAFLQEHSNRIQQFHTLDLHYLYVKEAISALDMFLDKNIRLLYGTNKHTENLFIITGRGKRSEQGRSRIKPAVIARLKRRAIWFCELNPGLLKIRVRQHSVLTNDMP